MLRRRASFARPQPLVGFALITVGAVACTSPERRFSKMDASADAAVETADALSSLTATEGSDTLASSSSETSTSGGNTPSDTTTSTISTEDSGGFDSGSSGTETCAGACDGGEWSGDSSNTDTDESKADGGACDGGCSEAPCDTCEATSTDDVCSDCDDNATCNDAAESFTCECKPGYTGDGFSCADIDECEEGTHDCHADANCANTAGSFTCACKTGFSGDGRSCTNIDECDEGTHDCGGNESCRDTAGAYTCECKSGFVRNTGECVPRITYVDFLPTAVNPNGTVVAGRDDSAVWRWTQAEGVARSLETDRQLTDLTRVVAISADGRIVTATASGVIVRWVGTAPGITPQFTGIVSPMDASNDGALVVGVARGLEAFAWNMDDAQPSFPLVEATESSLGRAFAVSSDGNVITGNYPASQSELAFRLDRRQASELQTLGLPEGYAASAGFDISADGEVVVGAAWDAELEDFVALRWQGEAVTTLPAPSGASVTRATSTNRDGTRIVGDNLTETYPHSPPDQQAAAIYWSSPATPGVFLHSHLESLGIDVEAIAEFRDVTISDDGKTLVGTAELAAGPAWTRGFILRLP